MSCYYPLKAIRFSDGSVKMVKYAVLGDYASIPGAKVIQVPCGQCSGCRMDYAKQWANRLLLELEQYKDDHTEYDKKRKKEYRYDLSSCHFITLTFDDDCIESIGDESGTYKGQPWPHIRRPFDVSADGVVTAWSHSICKRDLQLFMKRLRKRHKNDKIRFFACGEYGTKSARPHYHIILFGCHFSDGDLNFLKKVHVKGKTYDYQTSKELTEIWPYGFNVVAPVTWESCCYVARYMMKKIKGKDAAIYDYYNIEEPFTVMSRRPGIANWYYKNRPMDVDTVNFVLGSADGKREFPPPRYLEKLFELDNPEDGEKRKQSRRLLAENNQSLVLNRTDLDWDYYLEQKDEIFKHSLTVLDHYRSGI